MSADVERGSFGNVGNFRKVQGKCPSCGSESLFLADGGYVTCSIIGCDDPCAANDLLEGAAIAAMQEPVSQDEPLSMSRLQMLDHFLARGIALSTNDIEDLRALIRSMPVSYSHPAPEPDAEVVVTAEQIVWQDSLLNDGKYEYTTTGDCDGTVWAYLRREPAAEVVEGLWTHIRKPGAWATITEAEYNAGIKVLP